jgi:hypothetical protein
MHPKFINLTPHAINLICGPTFAPSGNVARVKVTRQACFRNYSDEGENEKEITFYAPSVGEVEGLPDTEDDTYLIVSAMVRTALPNRLDLVSPGNLVRDDNGNVIGCDGFDCNYELI